MRHFICLAVVSATMTACSQSSVQDPKACASSVNGSESKVQVDSSWAATSESSESSAESRQSRWISAGTTLSAVLKDDCFNGGVISSAIRDRAQGKTPSGVRSYKWKLERDMTEEEVLQLAKEDACVAMIADLGSDQPSMETNDPAFGNQSHLTAIGASEAYDIFYNEQTGIKTDVVIAVVDSGVDLNHEDLKANLWVNVDEIPGNGIDDDHNGYTDDVYGYNFASNIPSPMYQKTSVNSAWQYAHGTRVAGLAAAVAGNGKGGTGVAGTAKIMALNNMGTGTSMDQSDTANAIRYATDNGANVINLSLGGSTTSADLRSALNYAVGKGVVILAAAGNESGQMGSTYSAAGPASGIMGLMSIANIQAATLQKSSTSNYSTTYVELGAPGTNTQSQGLYTTAPGNSYSTFSGTSAATPVASGAAALAVGLVKSRGYSYTAGDIENLMLESAQVVSSLKSYVKGGKALSLSSLAHLIDSRYPQKPLAENGGEPGGGGQSGTTPEQPGGESASGGNPSNGIVPGTGICTS